MLKMFQKYKKKTYIYIFSDIKNISTKNGIFLVEKIEL